MKVQSTNYKISRVILYAVLIALAFLMLVPFAWITSASLKLDKDVFIFRFSGYRRIRDGETT